MQFPETRNPFILLGMEHLKALHEKIAILRLEIAEIQRLNEEYRAYGTRDPLQQAAYEQRRERLLEIKQELGALAGIRRP
jgi:hypothetical protein